MDDRTVRGQGVTRLLSWDRMVFLRLFARKAWPHRMVLRVGVQGSESVGSVEGSERVERVDGVEGVGVEGVVLVSALRGEREEVGVLFGALGELWVRGVGVDWAGVFVGSGARRVGLPSYAFQRERYWLDAGLVWVMRGLLGWVRWIIRCWVVWLGWLVVRVGCSRVGCLSGSIRGWQIMLLVGTVLFPGTGLLELVSCAAGMVGCGVVSELVLESPLVLGDGQVQLQVTIGEAGEDGRRLAEVFSRVEDSWFEGVGWASAW